MESLTQWTWVWAGSRSWWRTGKPGVLQSMGSQRDGNDWATELNWLRILFQLQIYLVMESLGHMEILCSKFWGTIRLFSKAATPFHIPTNTIWGSYFFTSLPIPVVICLFHINYLGGYKVVSPYGFDLHFLVSKMLSIFPCVFICLYIVFDREGNGNPLQCSCLENPMDSGA